MKSKLFKQFYDKSYEHLYPVIKQSNYFQHLTNRLNIFTTESKRTQLVQQKIDYIFQNFDLGNIPILMDEKAKYPKYTKDGVAVFPSYNEERNFFDCIYLITEIMMVEFLNKKKSYDDLFASVYIKNVERVFKIHFDFKIIFPNMNLNKFEQHYDDFINREAWSTVYKKFNININDMKCNQQDLSEQFIFEENDFNIIVNVLLNKKIKVFSINNK